MLVYEDVVNNVTGPRTITGSLVNRLVPQPGFGDKELVVRAEVQ